MKTGQFILSYLEEIDLHSESNSSEEIHVHK